MVLTRDVTYRKKPNSPAVLRLYDQVFKEYPGLLEKIRTAPERYNETVEEVLAPGRQENREEAAQSFVGIFRNFMIRGEKCE